MKISTKQLRRSCITNYRYLQEKRPCIRKQLQKVSSMTACVAKYRKEIMGNAYIWKCYIFDLRRKIWRHHWSSQLWTQFIQLWNSGLNGIRTHDLSDTGAVLYQLSYQANWELVTLSVCNIPVEGEKCKWIYEISYICVDNCDVHWCLHVFLRSSNIWYFM